MNSSRAMNPVKQHGLALLIFIVVLAFASISYSLGNISVEQLRSEQAASTQSALQRAKQALLDHAVTYEDSNSGEYGFLPCPDYLPSGNEGGSDGNCGAAQENVLGLFPWASLETGILRSGTGECLWYGVSGEYKSSPKTSMLNQDTNGAIRLYEAGPVNPILKRGAAPEDRIVAVIIDPSEVIAPGQNRVFDDTSLCGMDYAPARYLEGLGAVNNASLSGGALVIDDFIVRGLGSAMNDQMVFITREELWDTLRARGDFIDDDDSALNRITEALARCIAEYGNRVSNRRLPRPAAIDFAGADYRERFNYSDTAASSYLGRFPFTVNDSDSAIGHGSVPDPSQARLFLKGFCSALPVPDGDPVNLESGEGYTIWENWKDHFFLRGIVLLCTEQRRVQRCSELSQRKLYRGERRAVCRGGAVRRPAPRPAATQ